jgi:hypothetical protein
MLNGEYRPARTTTESPAVLASTAAWIDRNGRSIEPEASSDPLSETYRVRAPWVGEGLGAEVARGLCVGRDDGVAPGDAAVVGMVAGLCVGPSHDATARTPTMNATAQIVLTRRIGFASSLFAVSVRRSEAYSQEPIGPPPSVNDTPLTCLTSVR